MLLNIGKCSSKRGICSEFDIRFSRYAFSLAVADWSGQAWLQGFNNVGITLFGMPANDLVKMKVRLMFH